MGWAAMIPALYTGRPRWHRAGEPNTKQDSVSNFAMNGKPRRVRL
jgi:hypothetical protein